LFSSPELPPRIAGGRGFLLLILFGLGRAQLSSGSGMKLKQGRLSGLWPN